MIFTLYPFSWAELIRTPDYKKMVRIDENCLAQRLVGGFYPEFFVNPNLTPEYWYGSYLTTYLERDVRNVKNIVDLSRFQTFIGLLAPRAGNILNIAEIAKECGITQPTAKAWLSVLESTYVIYLLKPFHANITKRYVKSPKLYFVDTGLLCYLLGIDSVERFLKASERGNIFENMIIIDLLKQASYDPGRREFFFFRSGAGVEIDLLLKDGDGLTAFEIKFSKSVNRKMASNLVHFRNWQDVASATVVSLHDEELTLAADVHVRHWSQVLLQELAADN